jgi:hypothetical protein
MAAGRYELPAGEPEAMFIFARDQAGPQNETMQNVASGKYAHRIFPAISNPITAGLSCEA